MNERIKALMGQTLDEKFAGTWSTMDMQDLTKFAERFAELIVKECARVAKITEPDAGDEYASGRTWAGIDVLKHFGVEE